MVTYPCNETPLLSGSLSRSFNRLRFHSKKWKLGNTVLFSSLNADENAPPPAMEPPKNPLPILTPRTYMIIVEALGIVHSFPGILIT